MKRKAKGIDAGFTFVETLAVLAVTAILASQAGVAANAVLQRARVAGAKAQIEQFKIALQSYYVDCGSFPTDEQGLSSLWKKPELIPVPERWNGPYTDRAIPFDPWGNAYQYHAKGSALLPVGTPENIPFVIISYGVDGKEGGTGNASDIISWE